MSASFPAITHVPTPSEAVVAKVVAPASVQGNDAALMSDDQWLQTLPTRITQDHQQKVQETRQAAGRRHSPVSPEGLSHQLAAFRKVRETRFK